MQAEAEAAGQDFLQHLDLAGLVEVVMVVSQELVEQKTQAAVVVVPGWAVPVASGWSARRSFPESAAALAMALFWIAGETTRRRHVSAPTQPPATPFAVYSDCRVARYWL